MLPRPSQLLHRWTNEDAGLLPSLDELESDSFAQADPFAAPAGGVALRLARPPARPSFPECTRLWREANYYKNTEPTDETLIPLNRFWLDLALLDLPFNAERPLVIVDGSTLRVKAREPMLLFYKDTRANETLEVALTADQRETSVELPEIFRKGNVLVSAASGTRELLKILDSRALGLRHLPLERTVQVFDPATSLPLQKAYIKVYAETQSGEVKFHKDGYTALRGKFDYISYTGVDVSSIKRFALLASDPQKGARTVIYER